MEAVRRVLFEASYMVLGLGDVYLGAPCAVPVDPRHRLVVPKYNPARTYTPEGGVGIGGTYMCIVSGLAGRGALAVTGEAAAPAAHSALTWQRMVARPGRTLQACPVQASRLQRPLPASRAQHALPPPPPASQYPMASPGGYQLVGRTLPIWNPFTRTGPFQAGKPWLLRNFDQARPHGSA